ncbi:DUF6114 domain-containing protein [Winogradskya humida]|uniref:Uncharacterized protein n=1 Tax=Winogradskya humida TaxID=113566 RepID=A0ABQ3ZIZ7_9ACTN|nr:DUF6114 domain-containing protein [Actinoplanes humidus]GIE18549.1 hypothetical protein Ahu01nite_016510 [Actinoplanes humidus]
MPSPTWAGFHRWRRTRPFWGGLLLLLAGLELFISANQSIGDLEVHFGPEGFLSYLLPLILVLCGVLTWLSPGQRLFYGILGLLTAVYSLIGLNFGGFALGMLLGIIGGALVLAWAPRKPSPAPVAAAHSSPPGDAPLAPDLPYGAPPARPARPVSTPEIVPGLGGGPDTTQVITPGGSAETAKAVPASEPAAERPGHSPHRKALVITLVPLAVTAALLIAGSHAPARADVECPEGLPSRSTSASPPASSAPASSAPASSPAARKIAKKPATVQPSVTPRASTSKSPTPAAEKSDDPEEGDRGNPLTDVWNGLVDGVDDILGGDDEPEAGATPSAEPSADPVPTASVTTPGSPEPSASTPGSHEPSASVPASPEPSTTSGSAAPSPSPSLDEIPCLGPRVFKDGDGSDLPLVAAHPALLESDSLTMYDSTYDGVVDVPTAEGTLKALKFSMDKAVTKPFRLTVQEKGGNITLFESGTLTTEGNVRLYATRFEGKLFGVIPVIFTPEMPPPLTLPVLWFTDVKLQKAFIHCDTLTADPLVMTEKKA